MYGFHMNTGTNMHSKEENMHVKGTSYMDTAHSYTHCSTHKGSNNTAYQLKIWGRKGRIHTSTTAITSTHSPDTWHLAVYTQHSMHMGAMYATHTQPVTIV